MASLRDVFFGALDEETELTERFGGACILAANEISREDAGTKNHEARVAWAQPILDFTADPSTRKRVVLSKGIQIKQRAFGSDPDLDEKLNSLSDEEIVKITNDQINQLTAS